MNQERCSNQCPILHVTCTQFGNASHGFNLIPFYTQNSWEKISDMPVKYLRVCTWIHWEMVQQCAAVMTPFFQASRHSLPIYYQCTACTCMGTPFLTFRKINIFFWPKFTSIDKFSESSFP